MSIAKTLRNIILVSAAAYASYHLLLDEEARTKASAAAKTLISTARDLYNRLESMRGQEIDEGLEREIAALRQRWAVLGY